MSCSMYAIEPAKPCPIQRLRASERGEGPAAEKPTRSNPSSAPRARMRSAKDVRVITCRPLGALGLEVGGQRAAHVGGNLPRHPVAGMVDLDRHASVSGSESARGGLVERELQELH